VHCGDLVERGGIPDDGIDQAPALGDGAALDDQNQRIRVVKIGAQCVPSGLRRIDCRRQFARRGAQLDAHAESGGDGDGDGRNQDDGARPPGHGLSKTVKERCQHGVSLTARSGADDTRRAHWRSRR